ncbi:SigE family RNA polymerase sigma factor [Myceligenerans pegani]|uniref:SigE family RNA polymerase sigma factor n=1 Tax=Myceligenerans pegani TaxID=2776917 RepID=A0ABR9MYP4_9MICO|nr:SigE family RNA polymerase sigma factor [Myceligenerans sp. TRM 65318]MBE1875978.1 SigE family RNA polymerase sigma factor [Myceligenerans sp. TRM 65318]MBE3018249.1 SigE family RNA polymerase sigma factor [Myceligenerans sp. TRM 65318]
METLSGKPVEVRVGGRSRDEEFVAFVESDGPYLFRTAFFLVGERVLAEDLVQGTFERVYRRWDAARAGAPRAYARRVLVNLRTDTWRRTRLTDVPGDDNLPVAHADDHAARIALRDELARALGSLPPQQRRVVVLRHVLDLPEAQVAREIGRSIGTVKAASSRGLERLRSLLTDAAPETADEPVFDGRETLTRSKTAAARRARRTAALGAAAVAVCAFVALVVHGPVGVPVLDTVTAPAHRWLVETFRLPSVDTSRTDGPVPDEDAVAGQDDAVGLGDLDIPEMAVPAAACAGPDLAVPDATRTIPVPGDAPTGDYTVVQALDAEDARAAIECVDYIPEHRVSLGSPPDVMVGSGIGADPNVPFRVRRDGTLVAALGRPDVGPGSEPVTALARPVATGSAGEPTWEHWQLTTAASDSGSESEHRSFAGVGSPVLTDTHVAWTEGFSDSASVVVKAQGPDGEVRTVTTYRPDPGRLVWKIAAGGRTLAILHVMDETVADPDRCAGRIDLVDLEAPGTDLVRDVVTDVCAISDGDDGVVVSRSPADGPSTIGLLSAGAGLHELVRLDQSTAWNHYAYLSGDTLLFESGPWIVALDTDAREATVVREDASWPVGAFDDGVLWADGRNIYFLRLGPRDGVAVPALTTLGPEPDDGTAWLDVAGAANRVVWTEHDVAELERLQSGDSWSYRELRQTVVYVRTSW